MRYPELPQMPLPCLPGADAEVTRNVTRLAHALQRTLAEAVIALNLFETAYTEMAAMAPPGWYQDEPDLDASLEPVRGALATREPRPGIYYDVAPQLHARTYVLSLRMMGLYLNTIAEEAGPGYPDVVRIAAEFETSFPYLKDLRDSIIHAEDRLRHLDRKGKKIAPQEVPGITKGGNVFLAGVLHGRSLGWTLGDGTYDECEVSERTLATAAKHIEEMMCALV